MTSTANNARDEHDARIGLSSVCVRAGSFRLRDITLSIDSASWWLVLGPAGSGKTTLLESIAGVRRVETGRVTLRGVDVTASPPEVRRVGMVYQRGYLFPHLDVAANIGYAATGPDIVKELVERFEITALLDRPVDALSGGERQLVSLARALASSPDILLLDEPFSALDPRRRNRARSQLVQLQRETRMTVVQVTHDFAEAGLLGDAVVVLHDGAVVQAGAPEAVFRAPATAAVAEFLGAENVFAGVITPAGDVADGGDRTLQFDGEGIHLTSIGDHPGGHGHAVIRGEDITILTGAAAPSSARNVLVGAIREVSGHGVLARVAIAVGESLVIAIITRAAVTELQLAVGMTATASIKATAVHLC